MEEDVAEDKDMADANTEYSTDYTMDPDREKSGISSVISGVETPDVDLRKNVQQPSDRPLY
jgi:hypothetical protein